MPAMEFCDPISGATWSSQKVTEESRRMQRGKCKFHTTNVNKDVGGSQISLVQVGGVLYQMQ